MKPTGERFESLFRLIDADPGGESAEASPAPRPGVPRDADLLDAYSQAVIGVVRTAGPAVISVAGRRDDRAGGMGSGFLITPDGYALTNSHVVRGRSRLRATTHEGDSLDAEVIGDDPATDTALIRVVGPRPPLRGAGRLRDAPGRATGDRRGEPAGLPIDRLDRRGRRAGPVDAGRGGPVDRRHHPAHRAAEPRQFRRAARRLAGPGRRDQHGDHPDGARAGLRRARQHGQVGRRRADRPRQGPPALPGDLRGRRPGPSPAGAGDGPPERPRRPGHLHEPRGARPPPRASGRAT